MNDFRFSADPLAWTCSAETMVPWMISSSMPAAMAGPASTEAFCGESRIGDRAAAVPQGADRLGQQVDRHRLRSRPSAAR